MDEESRKQLGIFAFTRAVCADWLTRMSWPLSVPAAFLALWLSNHAAKIVAGITAFVCLWTTAYALWRKERAENLTLQTKVGPMHLREIKAQEAHTEAIRRQTRAIESQNDPFKQAMRQKQVESFFPKPSAMSIEIGDHGQFLKTEGGLYDIKRTFNIKLLNIHGSKSAEHCKLQIVSIENQTEYEGPWILKEWRTLPAGDHDFIPLSRYGEARNPDKYNCADSFFIVLAQPNEPKLDIGKEYTLLIRATAHDVPHCELRCKLWVGKEGRFHIEKA